MRHNQLLETAKDGETLLMLSSPQGAKRIRKKCFPLKTEFNQVDRTVAALWNLSVLLVCMPTLFIYVYYIYLYLSSSSPPALNHLCQVLSEKIKDLKLCVTLSKSSRSVVSF